MTFFRTYCGTLFGMDVIETIKILLLIHSCSMMVMKMIHFLISKVLIKFTPLKTHDSDNVSTSNETPYSAFGIH